MTDRRKALEQGARRINRVACNQMQNSDVVWYVVLVRSGKEFLAQQRIHKQSSGVYMPLCRKWRRVNRYARKRTKIAYPVIPGCLFLGHKLGEERWFDLFRMKSVYGVLGVQGCPAILLGARLWAFIEENRFRFSAPDEEQFMRTHHEFKIGDRVRVAEGPFEGHVVDVWDIKGPNAYILMDLLGGTHDIEISLDKLENAA